MLQSLAALGAVAAGAPAHAQLGLPRVTLPTLPRESPRVPGAATELVQTLVPLQSLRKSTVRDLLRDHADVLEPDPAGEPIPAPGAAARVAGTRERRRRIAQGFVLLREQALPELGLTQP